MVPVPAERHGFRPFLPGKSKLRRSGIFRLNAIAHTYEQDVAPTELIVVLYGAAIKISLLRSLLSKTPTIGGKAAPS
jgi:hypothetical protein